MDMRLSTCTLRPWRPEDLESLVRHADDPAVAINLRDRFPSPFTREDGAAWLAACAEREPQDRWAVVVGGDAVGGIGLTRLESEERHTLEIGYWLGAAAWGRGIMSEAVRAVTAHAFAAFDAMRVEAGVYEGNDASMRVLEKAGYVLEGRLRRRVIKGGVWRDQFMYAVVRER